MRVQGVYEIAGPVSITLFGDKAVEKMFRNLPRAANRRVVTRAIRASAKRNKKAIADAAGRMFTGGTGRLVAGLRRAKIKSQKSRAGPVVAVLMPTRAELGISMTAKAYYPYSLEYGRKGGRGAPVPAKSYIRATVDGRMQTERPMIQKDILSGIEREAKKLAGKARKYR